MVYNFGGSLGLGLLVAVLAFPSGKISVFKFGLLYFTTKRGNMLLAVPLVVFEASIIYCYLRRTRDFETWPGNPGKPTF